MSTLDETRFIERQQFFNGQRLLAADLQGLEAFNREMRWLHNASLHQPGIGSGLAVFGEKGDRQVRVMPGYALDALGREIVLIEPLAEQVPPVAGDESGGPAFFDLAIAYPRDDDLEEVESRQGLCDTLGTVRLQEKPILCWIRLVRDQAGNYVVQDARLQKDINDGLKIVLARAEVLNCQLNKPLSVMERRNARPAKTPYLDCGIETDPVWEPWGPLSERILLDHSRNEPVVIGLQTTIDTSQAGFTIPPCYTARLDGPRLIERVGPPPVIEGFPEGPLPQPTFAVLLYQENLNITDATPDSFRLYMLLLIVPIQGDLMEFTTLIDDYRERMTDRVTELGGSPAAEEQALAEIIAELGQRIIRDWIPDDWSIVWMGIEG
ncbi:MAG: hypothetical protein GXY36_16860 [Chloroflexi bacterium]|jgi:hypothetical protein|nr:hypothetical protein [Chloroflexota bacterium]